MWFRFKSNSFSKYPIRVPILSTYRSCLFVSTYRSTCSWLERWVTSRVMWRLGTGIMALANRGSCWSTTSWTSAIAELIYKQNANIEVRKFIDYWLNAWLWHFHCFYWFSKQTDHNHFRTEIQQSRKKFSLEKSCHVLTKCAHKCKLMLFMDLKGRSYH